MYLTPNRLVAYNMRRARRLAGWTQADAAEMLMHATGKPWTAATVSAAERSITGSRVREFDADELFGIASAFRLPVHFFFLPAGDDLDAGVARDVWWNAAASALLREDVSATTASAVYGDRDQMRRALGDLEQRTLDLPDEERTEVWASSVAAAIDYATEMLLMCPSIAEVIQSARQRIKAMVTMSDTWMGSSEEETS